MVDVVIWSPIYAKYEVREISLFEARVGAGVGAQCFVSFLRTHKCIASYVYESYGQKGQPTLRELYFKFRH